MRSRRGTSRLTMTLAQLNALSRADFVKELDWVFEGSPWVAGRAWPYRPFATLEELHGVMTAAVEAAAREEQLQLLCAYPELGCHHPMSEASSSEQAAIFAGDPNLSPRTEKLRSYRDRFGFPFIYAIKGSRVEDIELSLLIRLESTPEDELHQALQEVRRIAWFRLLERYGEP